MVMCWQMKLWDVWGSKWNESETSADYFDASEEAVHIAVGGIPSQVGTSGKRRGPFFRK